MQQVPWDAIRTSPLTLMDCLHLRIRATDLGSRYPGLGSDVVSQTGSDYQLRATRYKRITPSSATLDTQYDNASPTADCSYPVCQTLINWLAHDATKVTRWRTAVTARATRCVATTVARHFSAIGLVTSTRTGQPWNICSVPESGETQPSLLPQYPDPRAEKQVRTHTMLDFIHALFSLQETSLK
jgi:hypothetical protein